MDQGSGRLEIYRYIFENIQRMDLAGYLFGTGYFETRVVLLGTHAPHNEWLHIFFEFGAVGTLFYTLFLTCIVYWYIKMLKARDALAIPIAGSLALMICLSMYSIFFFSHRFYMLAAVLGALVGVAELIGKARKHRPHPTGAGHIMPGWPPPRPPHMRPRLPNHSRQVP